MKEISRYAQTVLSGAEFGPDGVVRYYTQDGCPVHLVYSIAQQAMLGRFFHKRYVGGEINITRYFNNILLRMFNKHSSRSASGPGPYAEYIDFDMLPDPTNDPVARSAARWLTKYAKEDREGGIIWRHNFDFTFTPGGETVARPWLSGIGQANALLACLHWWRYSGDSTWRILAEKAVQPFCRELNSLDGVFTPLANNEWWFEEYPTTPPTHILNCHMLSLIVLELAYFMLNSKGAGLCFERGFKALINKIEDYDRSTWSRYDIPSDIYLFIRLVPSANQTVALARAELLAEDGHRLGGFDATTIEPVDDGGSGLLGIDWGGTFPYEGRTGRYIPNCQHKYSNFIPDGGTNQNTYIMFREKAYFSQWKNGIELQLELYLGNEEDEASTAIRLEFQDWRTGGLNFFYVPDLANIKGSGWRTVNIPIAGHLIGRPLARHYHRLHIELLESLLSKQRNERLERISRSWQVSDLYDIVNPKLKQEPELHDIFIVVNDKCGLRCKMCDIGQNSKEATISRNLKTHGSDMEISIIEKRIAELGHAGKKMSLNLVGTEPLLYFHYPKLVKCAHNIGMTTSITSNGLMLELEAERLARIPLDNLYLSIDGSPEVHDEIRGRRGLFEKIRKGISAYRKFCYSHDKQAPKIHINFTISFFNHKNITGFFEAIKPLDVSSVTLNHLNYVTPAVAARHNTSINGYYLIYPSSVEMWERSQKIDFLKLFEQLEEARCIDWTQVSIIPYCPTPTRLKWYYTRPDIPVSRSRCAAPWNSLQVLCDGSVTILSRCYDIVIGDLRQESIMDIWRGEALKNFRCFIDNNPYLTPCLRCCGRGGPQKLDSRVRW